MRLRWGRVLFVFAIIAGVGAFALTGAPWATVLLYIGAVWAILWAIRYSFGRVTGRYSR